MEIIFDFLRKLKENNNREWFNENKDFYLKAKAEFEDFLQNLIERVGEFEPLVKSLTPKDVMFRIYRDTRFSKDKRPYKEFFCAFLAAGGKKSPFAGYYIHLEPENTFVGGGVYCPKGEILRAVREFIYQNLEQFKQIIENQDFIKTFGGVYGEKLKVAPRGFPKDFEHIDLLKYKSYALMSPLPEKFVLQDVISIFEKMKPFNDFLNKAIYSQST